MIESELNPLVPLIWLAMTDQIDVSGMSRADIGNKSIIHIRLKQAREIEAYQFITDWGERYAWDKEMANQLAVGAEIAELGPLSMIGLYRLLGNGRVLVPEEEAWALPAAVLDEPIIIAPMPGHDSFIVIDGWKRIARNLLEFKFTIPIVELTPEQELECRILGGGVDRIKEGRYGIRN